METLKTGATTINEVWWFEREVAKTVRDIGLRAVIAENISEHDLTKLHPDYQDRHYDADEGVVEAGRCVTVDEDEALRECERVAKIVWERARGLFDAV